MKRKRQSPEQIIRKLREVDQTMLSDWVRSVAIPNHFTRNRLGTDKGKARLDGVQSDECDHYELCGPTAYYKRNACGTDGSEDAAILGLATKFLAFSPSGDHATAGMNLVGAGTEPAVIRTDAMVGPDEANTGRTSRANGSKTLGSRGATIDRNATIRGTEEIPAE